MKRILLLATVLLGLFTQFSYAQLDHLAVQGSSTAFGYGVPEDSSFTGRLKKYYKGLGLIDTLHRVATLSLTCYAGMPTSYVPPSGRPAPDPTFNIDRTLSRLPKPTILIVNYPSNGYDYMTTQEVLFCLQTIKQTAESQGVRCFVTTTHPRDGFSTSEREKLRVMRDSIMLRFGTSAIDFWTPLVNPATNTIKTEYSLGDGVHINAAGHQVLFEQVVAKNVFNTTVPQPQISLGNDITRTYTSPYVSLSVPVDIQRLQKGTYTLMVTLRDSLGVDYRDTSLILISNPPNIAPTVNAGSDREITLPVNSLTLQGSGTDSDGSIVSWLWTQVAGPSAAIIGTAGQSSTTISNLVQGIYQFQLTISDNNGAMVTDIVQVTVNPAPVPINLPPLVNAGTDQMVQLPVNTVDLAGNATDGDGSIVSYSWALVSGPATYTILSPNLPQTQLRDLVAGNYIFRLQAIDNAGGLGSDTVAITVLTANPPPPPPVNNLPVVNAGPDQTIQLPINSVNLSGSAVDSDGTISAYAWTYLSGPATYTLVTPNMPQTQLTNLVAGTYSFRLQATDNVGGSGSDTIVITVLNANPPPPVTGSQRVLIDLGMTATTTLSPDQWGKYWNNMTDARTGLRVNNAVTTDNIPTTIKVDVIRPTGSTASYDNNMRAGDGVIAIGGQYPASATNDHAFAHSSITNGQWRIHGLDPSRTYTIKFWGSRNSSGSRFMQIKRADETVWKEYNASLNTNYDSAAKFVFTGKTEMYFDIRVRSGSTFSYINVLDITSVANTIAASRTISSNELLTPKTDDIQISPNPGSGRYTFSSSSSYQGQIKYFVMTNSGEIVLQGEGNKIGAAFIGKLDLTRYSSGSYYLTVVEGASSKTRTLIKE